MTGKELLEYEMNQAGRQINVCLEGMSEAGFDTKCTPVGMTPREMLEHLSDAYEAFLVHLKGEKYDFGSFVIKDKSTENIKAVFSAQRDKAVAAALAAEDDQAVQSAYDYLVGHDCYHVSQLVFCRLQSEPDWDSYAIYS